MQKLESYDSCHRLSEVVVKNPHILQRRVFQYDKAGNQISVCEHVYDRDRFLYTSFNRWEYGPCNRLERLIESDLKVTNFAYDNKGRLYQTTKPDGVILTRTYDEEGRLKTLSSKDIHYRYRYDNNDRLLEVEDLLAKTTTQRFYDPLGNLTKEILANGQTIERFYNSEGQRTKLKVQGLTVDYEYLGDQLSQLSFEGKSYRYQERNLAGKPTLIAFPSGTLSFSYDPCLRISAIESPVFKSHYTFDNLGNLIQCIQTDPLGKTQSQYTYDDLHQLLSENEHTYTYDSLYNRLSKDTLLYQITPLSQVANDGQTGYNYDPNGNLIRAGNNSFIYDSLIV